MNFENTFTRSAGVKYPIIMAPMFLVSNAEMMKAGMRAGIMATFPTLNYRNPGELEGVIDQLNEFHTTSEGSYGVNLIVQSTNPLYKKHLDICVSKKVPFYITSLGNPSEVITKAHEYGGLVYCDVTNLKHAAKCASLGCDGFIAVGAGAGGHAGSNALHVLVPALRKVFPHIPVVAAGGIAEGSQLLSMLMLGASAVSIGTRFIASTEANVNMEYKSAIVQASMDDIVLTEKLSGTPCAIINTPYAQKIGYRQNWLERKLNSNRRLKRYYKMLVQFKGMKQLEKSVKPGSYQNLWSAGQSVEMISAIHPTGEIVESLVKEMEQTSDNWNQSYNRS